MPAQDLKQAIRLIFIVNLALHLFLFWRVREQVLFPEQVPSGYPDFATYYYAGKIVRDGLGAQLYDFETQRSYQGRQTPLLYYNPPFFSLLFATFASLPYLHAYLLWCLFNLLFVSAVPFFLRPYLATIAPAHFRLLVLSVFSFFPVFVTVSQGQVSILLLLLFTLTFVCLKQGRETLAGGVLALGLFKFHLVWPLFLCLAVSRRWKAVMSFSLVGFLLALASASVTGWEGLFRYPSFLWNVNQAGNDPNLNPAAMPTVRGFLQTTLGSLLPPGGVDGLVLACAAALVFFLIREWAKRPWQNDRTLDLRFAFTIVLTLLMSYQLHLHDLSLLLLPIFLAVNSIVASQRSGRENIAWFTILFLLFSPVLYLILLHHQQPHLAVWLVVSLAGMVWSEVASANKASIAR